MHPTGTDQYENRYMDLMIIYSANLLTNKQRLLHTVHTVQPEFQQDNECGL
jgi:hypothetical protein